MKTAKQNLIFDTLDDRREMFILLGKLHPLQRVAFLKWCCKQSQKGRLPIEPSKRMLPRVDDAVRSSRYDERLTTEIFFDVWRLANNHGLDMDAALKHLETTVKSSQTK